MGSISVTINHPEEVSPTCCRMAELKPITLTSLCARWHAPSHQILKLVTKEPCQKTP